MPERGGGEEGERRGRGGGEEGKRGHGSPQKKTLSSIIVMVYRYVTI